MPTIPPVPPIRYPWSVEDVAPAVPEHDPLRYTAAAAPVPDLLDAVRRVMMSERARSFVRRVREAVEGLTYPSETDAPLEPFELRGFRGERLCAEDVLAHVGSEGPVVEMELDAFFAPAIEEQDWYGPEERAQAARFRELLRLLRESLDDIRVFKVGERSIDVYVIGRMRDGRYAGITTRVVET